MSCQGMTSVMPKPPQSKTALAPRFDLRVRMLCQGMTSVMPKPPQSKAALAPEVRSPRPDALSGHDFSHAETAAKQDGFSPEVRSPRPDALPGHDFSHAETAAKQDGFSRRGTSSPAASCASMNPPAKNACKLGGWSRLLPEVCRRPPHHRFVRVGLSAPPLRFSQRPLPIGNISGDSDTPSV